MISSVVGTGMQQEQIQSNSSPRSTGYLNNLRGQQYPQMSTDNYHAHDLSNQSTIDHPNNAESLFTISTPQNEINVENLINSNESQKASHNCLMEEVADVRSESFQVQTRAVAESNSNQIIPFQRVPHASSKRIGQGRSAFTQVKRQNQACLTNDQQINQHQQRLVVEEDSVFALGENLSRVLMEEVKVAEPVRKEDNGRMRRSDTNNLKRFTLFIVDTYQCCNQRYEYAPVHMNPRRELTIPSEGVLNNGYDNAENDYILRVSDTIITPEEREYEIIDMMGKGTFGQVVKCECRQTKELVAIKVIKNKKAFKNQGVVEIKILDIINRLYDPNGENPLVRMLDFFVYRDHLCIVFELLAESVYDLLKQNNYNGISLNFSRLILSQILDAMRIVKEARLIHCDLKPENILFKQKDNVTLKVIDFGSACFEGYQVFHYIQSRYYRSPEVLLGLPYDTAIDMWSLGCIAAELFLGIPIFPGNSEYDQLAKIMEILGPPPQQLIMKAKFRDKYFLYIPQDNFFRFMTPQEFQIKNGIRIEVPRRYINITNLDDLKQIFKEKKRNAEIQKAEKEGRILQVNFVPFISDSEMNAMDAFIDFLKGVLRIDKDQRWTPLMAQKHPFITREYYLGPFEPQREQERVSTNETGDDSMSEKSSSSKDSREYKVGSCPSKILYPQSLQQAQYLAAHQQQPIIKTTGSEAVFHGTNNSQSHRPPILSIPDEFFKGFMFGRLDQILSMSREQLLQYIFDQQQQAFMQQQQRNQMQQIFLQQQQHQMWLQQTMPGMQQMPGIQQQHPQFGVHHGGFMQPSQQQVGFQPPSQMFLGPNQKQFAPMGQSAGIINQQMSMGFQPQTLEQQVLMRQIQGNQQPRDNRNSFMPQQQQQFAMPNEQIIFNPPPYQQQKSTLYLNPSNLNDPQYQNIMMQQQQRRNQGMRGRGNAQEGGGNKGKAGSWQPPPGFQGQKYNQYYNQLNNPGQLIGRQTQMDQGAFVPQSAQQQQRKNQNQAFNKNDFKKLKEMRPIEEEVNNESNKYQECQDQSQQQQQTQQIPFPANNFFLAQDPQKMRQRSGEFAPQMQQLQTFQQPPFHQPPLQGQGILFTQQQFPTQESILMQNMNQFQQQHQPIIHNQGKQGQKPFPSPRDQQQTMSNFQKKNQFSKKSSNQQSRNQSQVFQDSNQSLNNSFSSQNSLHSQPGGSYLQRFEKQSVPKVGVQTGVPDTSMFNQSHYYRYSQQPLGFPSGGQRDRGDSDISSQNEEFKGGDSSFQSDAKYRESELVQNYQQDPAQAQSIFSTNILDDDKELEMTNLQKRSSSGNMGLGGISAQIQKQKGMNSFPHQNQQHMMQQQQTQVISQQLPFNIQNKDQQQQMNALGGIPQFSPQAFNKGKGSFGNEPQKKRSSQGVTEQISKSQINYMNSQYGPDLLQRSFDETSPRMLSSSASQIHGQTKHQSVKVSTRDSMRSISGQERNLTPILEDLLQRENQNKSSSSEQSIGSASSTNEEI